MKSLTVMLWRLSDRARMTEYGRKLRSLWHGDWRKNRVHGHQRLCPGNRTHAIGGPPARSRRYSHNSGARLRIDLPLSSSKTGLSSASSGQAVADHRTFRSAPRREENFRAAPGSSADGVGVLIARGGEGSGSLITADYALDQTRKFRHSRPPSVPLCKGDHQLIRREPNGPAGSRISWKSSPRTARMLKCTLFFGEHHGRKLEITRKKCNMYCPGRDPNWLTHCAGDRGAAFTPLSVSTLSLEIKGVIRQMMATTIHIGLGDFSTWRLRLIDVLRHGRRNRSKRDTIRRRL
jgi:hypothetical protein